jgi:hypothetical protein
MSASDEGGESGGRRQSAINRHYDGRSACRLQELAAGFPFEAGTRPRATKEANLADAVRVQSTQRDGLYSEAMTKWEYVTVPLLVHATKQILDNWGQDGWELVQVVPGLNPENLVAYLKRPIPASGAGA